MSSPTLAPVEPQRATAPARMVSLDVFRGVTIAAMILVNNPGNHFAYAPLQHAAWNGWTPTDLIFPFFLFIVGVSLVCSFESRIAKGSARSELMGHVVRRTLIIFGLGLALNGYPFYHLQTLRIYGVLQRIALCYFFASLLTLYCGRRARMIALTVLLVGYWALMTLVPVPGLGLPGRDVPLLDRDANIVAYFDRMILSGHLYEGTRDPEGLLSTLPAIATVLIGVFTGEWLRSKNSARARATWMLAAGAAGLIAGEVWGIWFPINKKLWTSSYVLLAGGLALICLAVCYWAIDMRNWRGRWTQPALVFGTNAIAVYTLAGLIAKTASRIHFGAAGGQITVQQYVFRHTFAHIPYPSFASLVYSLAFLFVCYVPIWMLYRKRIFIKI